MRRNYWIYTGIALVVLAGCRKHGEPVAATPQFTSSAASGMASQQMAQAAAQFGVQIYPGAEPDTAHFTPVASGQAATRTYLAYVTLDPMDRVVSFYKTLGLSDSVISGTTQLRGMSATGAMLTINVGRDLSSKTRFTITAIMPPTAPATQVAANGPAEPRPSNTRTYVTPPVTATRESVDGGWTFSTSNGGAPDSASAGQPPAEQSQPVEVQPSENSGQPEAPQDEQGVDETGNEAPQQDGPPGEPPL